MRNTTLTQPFSHKVFSHTAAPWWCSGVSFTQNVVKSKTYFERCQFFRWMRFFGGPRNGQDVSRCLKRKSPKKAPPRRGGAERNGQGRSFSRSCFQEQVAIFDTDARVLAKMDLDWCAVFPKPVFWCKLRFFYEKYYAHPSISPQSVFTHSCTLVMFWGIFHSECGKK